MGTDIRSMAEVKVGKVHLPQKKKKVFWAFELDAQLLSDWALVLMITRPITLITLVHDILRKMKQQIKERKTCSELVGV